MKTLRKSEKETVEIKNTEMEMNNAFDVLNSRLDIAEGKINEPEDTSIEAQQIEKQREKNDCKRKEQVIQEMWDNFKMCTYV